MDNPTNLFEQKQRYDLNTILSIKKFEITWSCWYGCLHNFFQLCLIYIRWIDIMNIWRLCITDESVVAWRISFIKFHILISMKYDRILHEKNWFNLFYIPHYSIQKIVIFAIFDYLKTENTHWIYFCSVKSYNKVIHLPNTYLWTWLWVTSFVRYYLTVQIKVRELK